MKSAGLETDVATFPEFPQEPWPSITYSRCKSFAILLVPGHSLAFQISAYRALTGKRTRCLQVGSRRSRSMTSFARRAKTGCSCGTIFWQLRGRGVSTRCQSLCGSISQSRTLAAQYPWHPPHSERSAVGSEKASRKRRKRRGPDCGKEGRTRSSIFRRNCVRIPVVARQDQTQAANA